MPAEQYSPWPQEHYSTGYAGASCGGMPDAGRAQDRTAASASMCLISAKGSQKEKRCGKKGAPVYAQTVLEFAPIRHGW